MILDYILIAVVCHFRRGHTNFLFFTMEGTFEYIIINIYSYIYYTYYNVSQ